MDIHEMDMRHSTLDVGNSVRNTCIGWCKSEEDKKMNIVSMEDELGMNRNKQVIIKPNLSYKLGIKTLHFRFR